MARIDIMFSRFSAFYSPLIATIAGDYLQQEGLEPEFSVATPQKPVREALESGACHVAQSAVSSSWLPLEQGVDSPIVHFAQINMMDGFLLVGRQPDPDLDWKTLLGKRVLIDHGSQPLAMFKYACHRQGVHFPGIMPADVGGPDAIEAAFRAGRADYAHLQGPAPQRLEKDGVAHIVASVGEAIGPVAFSSLAARRDWLETGMAQAFMRAYHDARAFVIETPAREVAHLLAGFFKGIDETVLAKTIVCYQGLGCWHPSVAIGRESYEVALDVFQHCGLITRRHPYEQVVVQPPTA